MLGGDLKTLHRVHGGSVWSAISDFLGFGSGEMQKNMSDPIKQQMLLQRGGFPWAMAGLSLLPMLMGKGQGDAIRNQMKSSRDTTTHRGGFAISPSLISKGLPLLKTVGAPLAIAR